MKKILGLTIAALMVMGLVGGGTWAYFSDTEVSTGNTIEAGTLNLTVDITDGGGAITGIVTPGGDGANEFIEFPTNLAPSDSGTMVFTATGAGSVDGTLTIASTVTTTDGVAALEPESSATTPTNNAGTDGDLDEYMGVWLTQQINAGSVVDILGATAAYAELEDLEAVLDAVDEDLTAADVVTFTLYWEIYQDVHGSGTNTVFDDGSGDDVQADDNVIQGDTATIDMTFTYTQTTP